MSNKVILKHKELGSLKQISDSLWNNTQEYLEKRDYANLAFLIEGAVRGIGEILSMNNIEEVCLLNQVKQGDLVIEREKHSCNVKFVEGADETGILLVDGVKDEYFEAEHGGFERFYDKYKLLCKKEHRED